MSKTKKYLDIKTEDLLPPLPDMALDENGNYPGEENYNREKAERQWELSKYSTAELHDEIFRRVNEPIMDALTQINKVVDRLAGLEGKPF